MRKYVAIVVSLVVAATVGMFAAPAAQAANYYRGISWYWLSNPDCGWYDTCYGMKVKASRVSCPDGLYVTLNEYDDSGNIVGDTIDSVDSLYRGDTAILIFPSLENSATEAGLSRMRCFNF
jgi:hypothetical protein